jgi:lipoyl(octanoyl) transferase
MVWRLLGYQEKNAFENMAIDEAVFRETIKNKTSPTLRFYGWQPAAVSIGYFQDLKNEVNLKLCRKSGVDVVRRMTGGKAVFHSNEVTYSLVAGIDEKIFSSNIADTYEKISLCLARGLSELGIQARLAQSRLKTAKEESLLTPCCFSVPAGNELLVDGRKICGSAQTRTRGGFLQHGALPTAFDPAATASLILLSHLPEHIEVLKNSVVAVNDLIESQLDPESLCLVLKKGFEDELGIELVEGSLTPAEEEWVARLIYKYESDAWNRERKKEPDWPD